MVSLNYFCIEIKILFKQKMGEFFFLEIWGIVVTHTQSEHNVEAMRILG